MRRERMSRPSSSVPHQWAEDGVIRRLGKSMWAGSWGAIQGANSANTTKMTTSTTPIAARGLRRAARGSEMARVDMGHLCLVETGERKLSLVLLHQLFEALERGYFAEHSTFGIGAGFHAILTLVCSAGIWSEAFHR